MELLNMQLKEWLISQRNAHVCVKQDEPYFILNLDIEI